MIRQLFVLIVVALASLVFSSTAHAQTGDSVTGTGAFLFNGVAPHTYTIAATSGLAGENADGTVLLASGAGSTTYDVECLHVATDEAAGVTTAYIGVWGPGASYSWITVVDDPAGDRVSGPVAQPILTTFNCAEPVAANGGFGQELWPVTAGDFVIVDGREVQPPPQTEPTHADQCRRGGHTTFGFENQGQCIAFVTRSRS